MKIQGLRRWFWLVVLGCGAPCTSVATSLPKDFVSFTAQHWDLKGAKVVEIDGREAITGRAILRDFNFENGVIEVDIKANGNRAFPGIFFRGDAAGNSEHLYIRPHQSGNPQAIQYAPAHNQQAQWQLYSGEGYTSAINIPVDTWVTLRIEVLNNRARIFFNGEEKPVLIVDPLKGGYRSGGIAISGVSNSDDVFLSNFRVTKTSELEIPSKKLSSTEAVTPAKGIIGDWQISNAFALKKADPDSYPDNLEALVETWEAVEAEPSGLVNISRHRSLVDNKPSGIYAKAVLHADKKETIKLEFGYSDHLTIFHNHRPVFRGNSEFRSRDSAFVGVVGYNDAVYLELVPGRNEILLLLTEVFGGWGFQARVASDD